MVRLCVASWQKHLPDYKIICWNEESFDFNDKCIYVREAYKSKRYAFVSDYVQAWALSEYGGIYIDSDVEVMRNLDEFLVHKAFVGFQETGLPFTALWGCEKGHELAEILRTEYESKTEFIEEINTVLVSRLLVERFGADANRDASQQLRDGLMLYPSNYFCVDFDLYHLDRHNYARHHFNTSWINKDVKPDPNFYKEFVYKKHMMRRLSESGDQEITINNIVENFNNDLLLRRIGMKKVTLFLLKSLLRLGKKPTS